MADGAMHTDPETGDLILPGEDMGPAAGEQGLHNENIAEGMSDSALSEISTTITEHVMNDERSRAGWEDQAQRFIETLGIGPESEPDDHEYEFSDTSDHPLLLTATTRFQAKALSAIMPSPTDVVRAEADVDIDSIEDPATKKAARIQLDAAVERVEDFYSWYLLKALDTYVEDTDQILYDCGLMGLGVRRIFVDRSRPSTPVQPVHVPLQDLIMSYDTKNFRYGRLTHRYDVTTTDLVRNIRHGQWRAQHLVAGMETSLDPVTQTQDDIAGVRKPIFADNGTHRVYDIFTHLFLPEDPHPDMLARPYVITVHAGSQKVLAIRRNWAEGDPEERPLEHFAGYIYHPSRSAVSAIGLGAILTNITRALRKAQRRSLDAAYIANHPSGFKLGTTSIRDDSSRIVPGELRDIDSPSGDIRASIMMNPFPGANQTLITMYDRMEASGKELGGIASIDFQSMMKSGVAAGPALAAYDESTEFQTSVHRRLFRGHASELDIIHDRMREIYGNRGIPFGSGKFLHPSDLINVKILPAMKPGHVSRQRAIMEAQTLLEMADKYPDTVSKREAITRFLTAIGTHAMDLILLPDPAESPPQPADPLTEYAKLMRNEPLAVGPTQNHQAHIAAHKAQMAGLQLTALPIDMGVQMGAMLASHIAEHEALDQMVKVASMLGLDLEQIMAEGIPPEMEAQIAPQLADAIAAVEAQRQVPEQPEESKIAIEQVKNEGRIQIEQMRTERETQKVAAQMAAQKAITEIREEAETHRNTTDNFWAVEIAKMKTGKPAVVPMRPAPTEPTARPISPDQRINP